MAKKRLRVTPESHQHSRETAPALAHLPLDAAVRERLGKQTGGERGAAHGERSSARRAEAPDRKTRASDAGRSPRNEAHRRYRRPTNAIAM
jgi:hypothetical protein